MRKLGFLITFLVFPLASILIIFLYQKEERTFPVLVKFVETGVTLREIIVELQEASGLYKELVDLLGLLILFHDVKIYSIFSRLRPLKWI